MSTQRRNKRLSDTDWLAKKNASRLADKIRAYWEKRGVYIETWVEVVEERHSKLAGQAWQVRSTLSMPVSRPHSMVRP